jgi:hypothetical protein
MNFHKRLSWTRNVLALAAAGVCLAQTPVVPAQEVGQAASQETEQGQSAPPQAQAPAPVTAGNSTDTPPVSTPSQTPAQAPDGTDAVAPGGRVFGVLPNYRTADKSLEGTTISWKAKLDIARKDSFDYPLVGIAAILAGIGQLADQNPSFGQGVKGYAERWGTAYIDQAVGNMFTEGIMPALLHEDPRYFRRGSGSFGYRTWYALSRIMVTKTDSGTTRFNYSEWTGNAIGTAISNLYYPDGRTASDNAWKLVEQCAVDGVSQVLKEFWPDIKKKMHHQK